MTTYLVLLACLISKSFTKNTSYNHFASIYSRMESTSATLKFFTWSWCICFLHMLPANSLPFLWSPFPSSFFLPLFSLGYRLFFETSELLSQETMACVLGHGMFNNTRFSPIGVGCSCCFSKSLTLVNFVQICNFAVHSPASWWNLERQNLKFKINASANVYVTLSLITDLSCSFPCQFITEMHFACLIHGVRSFCSK